MTLNPRLLAMLTLPPLLWAGNAIVGRLTVAHVPPLTLNALRWLLAFLILLPLGRAAIATPERRRDILQRWPYLAGLGLFGTGAYNALQYLALTTSTPINVTLIAAGLPIATLVLGFLLFGERPRRVQGLGALLSMAGVLTVLSRGHWEALRDVHFVRGDLFMLLALTCWSLYSWMLARPVARMRGDQRPMIREPGAAPRPWRWAEFLLVQTAFGLCWACAAAAIELGLTQRAIDWTPGVGAALLYVAIGPSVLAYWFWGAAVAQAGPATAGFYSNLTPLFAALLSAAVLGERPQIFHALAFALIVGGIWVSSRPPKVQGQG